MTEQEDLNLAEYQFGDERPLYMTDCTLATDCQGYGLCSLCVAFKFTIKLFDGKIMHFDTYRSFTQGDLLFHEFIGCDGRKWKVREDQVIWIRDNDPNYDEFNDDLIDQRRIEERKKKEHSVEII